MWKSGLDDRSCLPTHTGIVHLRDMLSSLDMFMLRAWFRANGCPWDARTYRNAEAYGRLEVEQWARENGCPEFM
jgi:hypothetical protein